MMLAEENYRIRESLNNQGVIFCYSGYMTEAILSGIGQAIKQKLTIEETDSKTVRSVFSVFVEQMQNVIRYSVEREPENSTDNVLSYGLITVGQSNGNYFVTCSNKIRHEDKEHLDRQLSRIQKMSGEELKSMYKKILKGDVPESSKGAGVGFIDIARKASQPIEYDFADVDGTYAFFTLKAHV
ncbi:MAG: hypothetical protein HQL75_17110 [Magnetococcales bacterium]|nr:hypothetical protein [Magnetococcales bacterium]